MKMSSEFRIMGQWGLSPVSQFGLTLFRKLHILMK